MKFSEDIVRKLKYIIAGNNMVNDYQIAHALGLTKTAYSNRKVNNSLPIEAIVKLCLKKNICINYVLSKHSLFNIDENLEEMNDMVSNLQELIDKIHHS